MKQRKKHRSEMRSEIEMGWDERWEIGESS